MLKMASCSRHAGSFQVDLGSRKVLRQRGAELRESCQLCARGTQTFHRGWEVKDSNLAVFFFLFFVSQTSCIFCPKNEEFFSYVDIGQFFLSLNYKIIDRIWKQNEPNMTNALEIW